MAHQRSCNGQSLSLSARQVLAALIDLCLQSVCSLSYKLCRLCCLQSLPQFFFRGVLLAPAQIVFNSSFEKHRFLWHNANHFPKRLQIKIFYIFPIDLHGSSRRIIKTRDQIHKTGFSGTCASNDTDRLSCFR